MASSFTADSFTKRKPNCDGDVKCDAQRKPNCNAQRDAQRDFEHNVHWNGVCKWLFQRCRDADRDVVSWR